VKSGKKLLSKTSKPTSSTISSPPKAAIATSAPKKEEVHRRRNALNDILRRRSGEEAPTGNDRIASNHNVEPRVTSQPSKEAAAIDVRMADRVAELERALVIAREEQESLREDLEKARKQSQEDQDTIDSMREQSRHSRQATPESPTTTTRSRDSYVKVDDNPSRNNSDSKALDSSVESRNRRQSHDDVQRQNYDLRHQVAQLQEQLVSQDVNYRNGFDRAHSHGDSEWNELRMRLHATEKESSERLQQLLLLKSSISSLTRSDSQITDSELVDLFTHLFNRIREWVISNFRRTKMVAGNLPAETIKALKALTPVFESIENADRLALFQALIADALMQILRESLVVGMPHTDHFAALQSFARSIESHGPQYREWRRATIRTIENNKIGQSVQQGKNDFLHGMARKIEHLLFTLTSVNLTTAAQAALMSILNATADVQRTIALQKAEYEVVFFRNETSTSNCAFDDQMMEVINDMDTEVDDDDDEFMDRRFLFCVFPGLQKFGDEWGNNTAMNNVLLKARVCCSR
jgi:hypothetical protein